MIENGFWGMMIAKEVDVCADYRKMSRKLNGRRKHCGINVTIVPTWTAVMKRRKRSQSSVERFGLAAGSI